MKALLWLSCTACVALGVYLSGTPATPRRIAGYFFIYLAGFISDRATKEYTYERDEGQEA